MARLVLALIAAGAVAVGVAWGLGALGVYLFFTVIAAVTSRAVGVGGDWLTKTSRGRFDENRRR